MLIFLALIQIMFKVFSSLWLKKSFIDKFFLFLLEVNIESGMWFFVQM